MVSPFGVMPQTIIDAGDVDKAIAWLVQNVAELPLRRYFLIGWARAAGVDLEAADYEALGFPDILDTSE